MNSIIVIAGATGDLGGRIVKALSTKNVEIRAIIRSSTNPEKIKDLEILGAKISKVDKWSEDELSKVCTGATCVVSVLAGLRDVIIDAQKVLLNAAIDAGVPRFIPSDYSLDFTKFSPGENRNLDLRREFHQYLDSTSISSTSIFNGAFTDLLTAAMPVIFFKRKLVVYWGDGNHPWQFTTMDDTAAFTANVAIDTSTPRYLHIAGDQITPTRIREVANQITGKNFKLLRTGGQGLLKVIINIAKTLSPSKDELYPAWQGMQYMNNMIDKRSRIHTWDNNRYPEICWTTVKQYLLKAF